MHIGSDGSSKLTIRLDPAELGHVRVEITRGQDGSSSVRVAVERVETLGRLQSDLTHLHLALDRAGVPEQRTLAVHLAPPEPAGTASGGSFAGGQSGGQPNSQGGAPGREGGQAGGFQAGNRFGGADDGSSSGRMTSAARAASYRRIDTGVDITA